MDKNEILKISSLGLAHIGDGVYELLTRGRIIAEGLTTAQNLHKHTISLVCATAQAQAANVILPMLNEEEQAIYKRGRNAKSGSVPKSCTNAEYSRATGLEALFGWLYLNGKYDRINEIYDVIAQIK